MGREDKQKEQKNKALRRRMGRIAKLFLVFLIVGGAVFGLGWLLVKNSSVENGQDKIVSRQGIHWHPVLHIFILSKEIPIPAGVGLGVVEQPIHTHEADNVLHMEFPGLVRESDLKLGNFFKIWGKTFTSECIFEFCNGPQGQVKMSVNGKPNSEYENYKMHDGDKIEIRYE